MRSLPPAGGVCLAGLLACASATGTQVVDPLVDIGASDPELLLDIRYATEDNFLGRAVYDAPRCLLVPDAAERLREAELQLRAEGYALVVWDSYRPPSVQYAMWEIAHDDFTPRAHRDATDLPAEAIATRERLERAMTTAGWIPLSTEWWHYAPDWERYPFARRSAELRCDGARQLDRAGSRQDVRGTSGQRAARTASIACSTSPTQVNRPIPPSR